VHLVSFIIGIYQDERSPERQKSDIVKNNNNNNNNIFLDICIFFPDTALEPTAILIAQASSFRLQDFPKGNCLL